PSGYEVRKNYEGADIVCYLPLDTVGNARRFLRAVRPVMAFFIKYEFWHNYLHILKHRGVPVYSVSSIFRPNQVFFRWYGRQYSRVLKCFTRFFVQNEQSRELLRTIGITNVDVVGDTRFDRVLQIREAAQKLERVEWFRQYNIADDPDDDLVFAYAGFTPPAGVFVAGSSWPPDEEIFIRYFREKQLFGYGKWKMIIAPHVIDEEHLQLIEKQLDGFKVVRYTRYDCNAFEAADVLVVDCFGLLSSIYRFATVCYVGGGFGVGIHNVVEAAVWGKPVFFGPNNQRFMEAQELKNCGGGIEIGSYDDFARQMDEFAANPQAIASRGKIAAECVSRRSGATERIFSYLGL
ncbi:MAG: 3-deoxy-D-manno-octulosonic acid transferase, partial [Muribaculaceae bacterium]|nr:3-deoxy-D-manno-octulosonic acid transferase [Muribaculaceae bacterium]